MGFVPIEVADETKLDLADIFDFDMKELVHEFCMVFASFSFDIPLHCELLNLPIFAIEFALFCSSTLGTLEPVDTFDFPFWLIELAVFEAVALHLIEDEARVKAFFVAVTKVSSFVASLDDCVILLEDRSSSCGDFVCCDVSCDDDAFADGDLLGVEVSGRAPKFVTASKHTGSALSICCLESLSFLKIPEKSLLWRFGVASFELTVVDDKLESGF